ncbi:hypothetical protein ES703_84176 [subsurface metagenome]
MSAPRVTLKLSVIILAVVTAGPSSPRVALTALLPKVRRRGKTKISPDIARKLNWKEASHRIWGLMPIIMAAAKARAVKALRCLPKSSAVRNRLAMMAPLTTGGCIPVIKA